MTIKTTISGSRGAYVGTATEVVVGDTVNGGVVVPGPQGPPGPPLRTKGVYTGANTPLPVDPDVSDYWVISSPIPTLAPDRANGQPPEQGDGMVWTEEDEWINVGSIQAPAGGVGGAAFRYVEDELLSSHLVNHNLGMYPNVSVRLLSTGQPIDPTVIYHDEDQLEIQLLTAQAIEALLS